MTNKCEEFNAALSSLQGEQAAKIAELEAKLAEVEKDAERLDFVQSQSIEGFGWCARLSGIGRGYRVHQDPSNVNGWNIRQAIDAAIQESKKGGSV